MIVIFLFKNSQTLRHIIDAIYFLILSKIDKNIKIYALKYF